MQEGDGKKLRRECWMCRVEDGRRWGEGEEVQEGDVRKLRGETRRCMVEERTCRET